jgi:hypothetical protein
MRRRASRLRSAHGHAGTVLGAALVALLAVVLVLVLQADPLPEGVFGLSGH